MNVKFTLEGLPEIQAALKHLSGQQVDKALLTAFRRTATPIPGYMAKAAKPLLHGQARGAEAAHTEATGQAIHGRWGRDQHQDQCAAYEWAAIPTLKG